MDCLRKIIIPVCLAALALPLSGCQFNGMLEAFQEVGVGSGSQASAQSSTLSTNVSSSHEIAADWLIPTPFPFPYESSATYSTSTKLTPVAEKPPLVVQDDLWWHFRQNMHWDLRLDEKRVQQELRWFKRHPEYLQRLESRLQNYLPYLFEQTQLKNMPAELALLPIVESALDVYAFSHGGAAGPWQFIRGTALHYKLSINEWYDGRRDVVASTAAALEYLEDLHNRFDSWELALAGYNAGQGNVSKALRKGQKRDFFVLALPRETRAYVPRLLALAAVVKSPESYGLTLPVIKKRQSFTTLNVHSQFQLSNLAELLPLNLDELHAWNPSINKWATPPAGPHRIIVPASIARDKVQYLIDAIPANQRVDWQEVTVKPGDTLSQIAARYRTDVSALKIANGLSSSRIRQGKKLLIPNPAVTQSGPPDRVAGLSTHTVKAGDSLWSISRKHKASMKSLMRLNHIGPKDPLGIGVELALPGGKSAKKKIVRKVRYKVRRGDSLARIASKFNVSVQEIARWNRLDTNRYLQPGQGLLVYVNVVGG